MKRTTKLIQPFCLILLGLTFLTACFDDDDNGRDCVEAIGSVVSETRSVSTFHSLILEGVGNVFLTQGSPQSLRVESHRSILDELETTVSNEVLRIELDGCIEGNIDRLDVFITIPEIQGLVINGVGSITGQSQFNLDNLDLQLTGVGDMTLIGETDFLSIRSTGVGSINAFDLTADRCEAVVTGTGSVQVTVVSSLDVTITGVGNLSYKGDPEITATVTGLGQLIDAN